MRTASARAVALSDTVRRQRVETREANQRVAASIDRNREHLRSTSPPARVLRDAHTVVDEPVLTVGRRGAAQPTYAPPTRVVVQRIAVQSFWFAPMVSALIGVAISAVVAAVSLLWSGCTPSPSSVAVSALFATFILSAASHVLTPREFKLVDGFPPGLVANRTKLQRFRDELGQRAQLSFLRPRKQVHLANDEYYAKIMATAMNRVKAIAHHYVGIDAWLILVWCAGERSRNSRFTLDTVAREIAKRYPGVAFPLGPPEKPGTVSYLLHEGGFEHDWTSGSSYDNHRNAEWARRYAEKFMPHLEALLECDRVVVWSCDATHVSSQTPRGRRWVCSWTPDGKTEPCDARSGSAVTVFNAVSRFGPLCDEARNGVYVVLDHDMEWNAETFLEHVVPKLLPHIQAHAVKYGLIPVFLCDGERTQQTFVPGAYQPHHHNLHGSSRADAYQIFGLRPGEGFINNADVADALNITYNGAEDLKSKLWRVDFVRNQPTALERMCEDAGIIALVTAPGSPAVNAVERFQRHMKYDKDMCDAKTEGTCGPRASQCMLRVPQRVAMV